MIVDNGGRYILEDVGSSNGTLVNGQNVTHGTISNGSKIKIGDTEMTLQMPARASDRSTPNAQALLSDSPGPTMIPRREYELAWLAVTSGPLKGESFHLSDTDMMIGRDPENAIVVSDPGVSRRHALLSYQRGEFVLSDLGSQGGTYVNGQALSGRTLNYGGTLEVGGSKLALVQV